MAPGHFLDPEGVVLGTHKGDYPLYHRPAEGALLVFAGASICLLCATGGQHGDPRQV